MGLLKKITVVMLLQVCLFSCTNESFLDEVSEKPDSLESINKSSLTEPIILGYFPSWSENWTTTGQGSKLRDIPEHVTHVFLAFARPNLRYQKGSLDIANTGIQTPYGGATLRESVEVLKSKGIKVILSVGGETYWGTDAAYDIDYQQIKDLVDDMGFEGIDWDFEPNGGFQTIGDPINVQRFIDFFNNSRAIMPEGEYVLACAPAGVGALGGLNNDDPSSPYSYNNRNIATGESDTNLHNATSPNQAISLFGFSSTGHMIPVIEAVGSKIDLIAYQGYNTGAASNRKIMYDAYKHYADQYGFDIAAGTHYPNEPWGPYYTYDYQNMADLSAHIASNNANSGNDGIMIWQLLLGNSSSTAYGYLHVSSQVLNGISQSQAIANAENYPESPYTGGGDGGGGGGGNGTGCESAAWNASTAYNGNQETVYQNKLYRARWWTQGDIPASNTGEGQPWEYIQDCDGSGGGGNNQLPSVTITTPTNNATSTQGESINITANASDSDGTITRVEFFQGNTKLGEDTTSPYSYNWTNAAVGTYNLTAVATDNDNGTTTSTSVSITVESSGGGGGGSCSGVANWQPYPTVYNQGDQVVYQGTLYEAQTGPIWVTPGSGEHWWKTIGSCN
ncbi:Ig-like domain-containing protein [Aquimarina sp. 2201CG5-10]|uniref:Ig-like domain-containing protein n=1 Tax=Aquimarina callyspongiae TaxID=3098150 RepID=UPI002AB5ABF0|nr:Ig-like domain-containing protein [Aquimarina sp. 2201CG5-10]MDY8135142.1 Ig-like domain-containing protein [Aquimarina sp. 2201CG5-10]